MANQNENFNTQPVETVMEIKPRRVWWKYVLGIIAMIIFIFGAYVVWHQYFSSEAKYRREVEKSALELPAKLEAYKKAMEEDIYGGKTPEETLQLFIEALKKGDIELASKYFALDDDTAEVDPKWYEGLKKAKEDGRINEIISIIPKEVFDNESSSNDTAWFVLKNKEGLVEYSTILTFNKHSGVWKIESL